MTRPSSPALDALFDRELRVLDHGFVRVVDYMGSDSAVVQAARVSYGSGTKTARDDEGLIRYLVRHQHTTPLEMCEVKLHVKLPIFVARQWIRHRTANVNEVSARYSTLDREFYVPQEEQVQMQSLANKQGRAGDFNTEERAEIIGRIEDHSGSSYDLYEWCLDTEAEEGKEMPLARELARMVLPTNLYTQWYWKCDLHNLLHFLRLRCDAHAQWEIRQYADTIASVVEQWVPQVWRAFVDYQMEARTFSRMEVEALRAMIERVGFDGEKVLRATDGMSAREIREFREKLGK